MHETPTPETDAAEFPVMTFPSRDNPLVVRSIIVRNLERRLTVAREALETLAKLGNGQHYGNSTGNIIALAALTKTAPKP
jgi:hypothetical protein